MNLNEMGLVKESRDSVTLEVNTLISSTGRANREGTIVLTIPRKLLLDVYGQKSFIFNDFDFPFGKELTLTVASLVFPELEKRLFGVMPDSYYHKKGTNRHFGVMPGSYYYKNGIMYFDVDLEPAVHQSTSVLLYSDSELRGYIGSRDTTKAATVFQFGSANLYGLIVPLDEIVGIGGLFQDGGYEIALKKMGYSVSRYIKKQFKS